MNVVWINTNDELASWSSMVGDREWLAFDSEFERRTTFFPQPGLLQFCDGETVWLIDPLKLNNWAPLAQLCKDVAWVLHAASEDLEVINYLCGDIPHVLFDTQVAANFVGYRAGIGFAELIESVLNESLDKSETRSDWLKRPLDPAQVKYAVDDALWLAKAYPALLLRLGDRVDWVVQEGAYTLENARTTFNVDAYFSRLKRVGELDEKAQARAFLLSRWREQTARAKDIPRQRLLKEQALVTMAKMYPKCIEQISTIEDIPPGQIRRFGATWLALLNQASEEQLDVTWVDKPLSRGESKQYKSLMAIFGKYAAELDIPREQLVSKKLAQPFVRGNWQSIDSLPEWRREWYIDAKLEFNEVKSS